MDDRLGLVNAIASGVNALAVVVLVGVTWWYARTTNRMLKQMERQPLPEWDLHYSSSPTEVTLSLRNNGLGPARQIQVEFSPTPANNDHLSWKPDRNLGMAVVTPGESLNILLTSKTPPYDGNLIVQPTGRWGVGRSDQWRIRIEREPFGHKSLTLARCERT